MTKDTTRINLIFFFGNLFLTQIEEKHLKIGAIILAFLGVVYKYHIADVEENQDFQVTNSNIYP